MHCRRKLPSKLRMTGRPWTMKRSASLRTSPKVSYCHVLVTLYIGMLAAYSISLTFASRKDLVLRAKKLHGGQHNADRTGPQHRICSAGCIHHPWTSFGVFIAAEQPIAPMPDFCLLEDVAR